MERSRKTALFVDVMKDNVYKDREYHDVLKYNRKLTEEELREWEFDFLENYEEK